MPALALAEALVRRGHPPAALRLVGSRRGLDATLWAGSGIEVVLLPGRGISRRRSVGVAVANLGAVVEFASALARATALLRRCRPAVVVALGGYASLATAVAAAALRVPVVVAEQNAVPGAANRVVGRWARVCAAAFPGTDLPRCQVTGNPLRSSMVGLDRSPAGRAQARAELGLDSRRRLVAAVGGSLGAGRINAAAGASAALWGERDDLTLYHVVGSRNWPEWADRAGPSAEFGLLHRLVPYEDRMDLLLRAADVVVSRAGGTTVAELAAAGVASVLVPLPGAPGDHQRANAEVLASSGAAVVVDDADLDGHRLVAEVDAVLGDPERQARMEEAARSCAREDAADVLAALVESCAEVSHG